MKFFSLIVFVLVLAVSATAQAAAPCYTAEEAKAEHLLRFHSKLMVITVTCRYASTGLELTPAYTGFTQKNLAEIRQAEATLMAYYKNNYKDNPIDKLDRLRTLLGNEFGQQIAQVSAPTFCADHRDEVAAFAAATSSDILQEAEAVSVSAKAYAPVCGTKSAKAGK